MLKNFKNQLGKIRWHPVKETLKESAVTILLILGMSLFLMLAQSFIYSILYLFSK